MKKILMRIYSINKLTPGDRNDFLKTINGSIDIKSDISKFSNAIGFKNDKSGAIKIFEILRNQYFYNIDNEIITIITEYKEHDNIFSEGYYHTSMTRMELLIKFQSYLYSKYRNEIYIELYFSDKDIPRRYYLAAHFLKCINGNYNTGISLTHQLHKKEKKWLEKIVNNHIEEKSHIVCYYCDTCHDNDPNFPFHTEIHTEKFSKYLIDEEIQYGYYKPSIYIPKITKEKYMINKLQHIYHKEKRKC